MQLVSQHGVPAQLRRAPEVRWVQAVVAHADTTEHLDDFCQVEQIRLQVQFEVLLERGAVEGLPYFGSSGIVRLAARLIVEVREECVSCCNRWLIHLLPYVAMLVWEDALPEKHVEVWVRCPIDLEGGPKVPEEVLPRPEEIQGQRLERARKEMQAVLEPQMLTQASLRCFPFAGR